MRYKRFKRYGRKRSTNVIRMKFQSFMDISTSNESMQIITISAGGEEILRRLSPQFGAYKYYKIGAISAKLVPASTLPVDPTGLSYGLDEGSTMTVDPRDQLTPGMMRITNGEDVFENISGLSDDQQHGIYNNMLLDPRWFKWMLQSGTSRRAYPRYWQIGQLHQDKWPGAIQNLPQYDSVNDGVSGLGYPIGTAQKLTGVAEYQNTEQSVCTPASNPRGIFQVGHRGTLGWLPTDGLQPFFGDNGTPKPLIASPPEVEVFKILLPKAYKTRYYYRLFITEEVLFREPIVNFGIPADDTYCYRPLDVFHYQPVPQPVLPGYGIQPGTDDSDTGGNYGDD